LRVGASAGRVRFSSLWSPRAPARWQGVHRITGICLSCLHVHVVLLCMFVSVETRSELWWDSFALSNGRDRRPAPIVNLHDPTRRAGDLGRSSGARGRELASTLGRPPITAVLYQPSKIHPADPHTVPQHGPRPTARSADPAIRLSACAICGWRQRVADQCCSSSADGGIVESSPAWCGRMVRCAALPTPWTVPTSASGSCADVGAAVKCSLQ